MGSYHLFFFVFLRQKGKENARWDERGGTFSTAMIENLTKHHESFLIPKRCCSFVPFTPERQDRTSSWLRISGWLTTSLSESRITIWIHKMKIVICNWRRIRKKTSPEKKCQSNKLHYPKFCQIKRFCPEKVTREVDEKHNFLVKSYLP